MALSGIKCPVMQWEGDNLEENWRRFKRHVRLRFTGPLKSRTEEENCSYLLIWVGQKERGIYNTWSDISDDDCKKLGTYYECFESHASPKANPVFARFKFHSQVQDSSEMAEKFITALRILAQDCNFKDPEEMIGDRIVFGTNSVKVRENQPSPSFKPPRGVKTCRNCGRPHNASAKCLARGQTCFYSKKLNHLQKSVNPSPADNGFMP